MSQQDHLLMYRTFFQYAVDRSEDIKSRNGRFVHYTSADSAIKIINNREVWLRSTSCMNDTKEVEHGIQCLVRAYKKAKVQYTLNNIHAGLSDRVENLFNHYQDTFRAETYIACFSEHDDDEDEIGRLSMWRGYGAEAGVAIVMKSNVFVTPSHALGAYTSPVSYMYDDQYHKYMEGMVDSINARIDTLKKFSIEDITNTVFESFRLAALCTKHPGFREEREWRVVFSPQLHDKGKIKRGVETVRGTPQIVYKLPLVNLPNDGLFGLEPNDLIDRIILSPSQFPGAMYDAFVEILEKNGVDDAINKVIVSGIPMRT